MPFPGHTQIFSVGQRGVGVSRLAVLKPELLNLRCAHESSGDLVRMWILLLRAWGGPGICIYKKLLVDAEAAGPQTTV